MEAMNCTGIRMLRWCYRHALPRSRRLRCKQERNFGATSQIVPLYDVIVVGGGHAGTEAAAAAVRMGCKTLLVTHKLENIGALQFNPSLGGIAKGHLMREVDALDGVCGRICDKSAVHYKLLNKSKNPAFWGPRAHVDRALYKRLLQEELMSYKNLELRAALVTDLLVKQEKNSAEKALPQCHGVILDNGSCVTSKTVVLCPGTFLQGTVHIGVECKPCGRLGEASVTELSKSLRRCGFKIGHLKIGVSARIQKSSVDFQQMSTVQGDESPSPFSFLRNSTPIKPCDQVPSYITLTNADVEKFVVDNTKLVSCQSELGEELNCSTSLENKFLKFPGRQQQIWFEPEGVDCDTMYADGFMCKLSQSRQGDLIRKIQSLSNAIIQEPAYEITYDYIPSSQLKPSLEATKMANLFLAGHVIGSAGYEEAAALGIVAGMSAACKAHKNTPVIIQPYEAYIGILIDDLMKSEFSKEPYRMCTTRDSNFMQLRPDNADLRLTEKGSVTGCVSDQRLNLVKTLQQQLAKAKEVLLSDVRTASEWSLLLDHTPSKNNVLKNGLEIFCLPTTNVNNFVQANPERYSCLLQDDLNFIARLKMEGSYHIAIAEHEKQLNEVKKAEMLEIPEDFNYKNLKLPAETREKFITRRPRTIGVASSIDGVTFNDVSVLLRFIKSQEFVKKKSKKHIRKKSN